MQLSDRLETYRAASTNERETGGRPDSTRCHHRCRSLAFQAGNPGQEITKEHLFFYIYGLLHSSEYRD